MYEDSFLHIGMRKKLVKELIELGIKNEDILNIIGKIPRHIFMEPALERHAYQNKPFPIPANQTISQPFTVAFQTNLLDIKKDDKILEIGTGSGYQAIVLYEMEAQVYTLERIEELYHFATENFRTLGYNNINIYLKDGFEGLEEEAPFDSILVTCGAKEIPKKLFNQLKIGGKMVIPVGDKELQKMLVITRIDEINYKTVDYGYFSFVPMLKKIDHIK